VPRKVTVVPHNPVWNIAFSEEAERITHALGDIVISLHHIGSTAITGIYAKPILDLLLEVEDIIRLDENQSAMEELGYEALGEFGLPTRRYFRKDDTWGTRTHQVHAYEVANPEITRHLAFRDYMIAHPVEAQNYSDLKQRLARAHQYDAEAYMDGKDPYIRAQEARALKWRSSRVDK
jgi:GrpB-like predicted nucleotidyltransferase (UPF0157 family)